jgi:hypothetical protein
MGLGNEMLSFEKEGELKGLREGEILGEQAAMRAMNNGMGYNNNNNNGNGGSGRRYRNSALSLNNYVGMSFIIMAVTTLAFS